MKQEKSATDDIISKASREIAIILEAQIKERESTYPPDPPNEVCHHAFIRGLSIENSFAPNVGDYIPLFGSDFETVYIWTHEQDKNSALVVDVNPCVRNLPLWRTLFSTVRLALVYSEAFESGFAENNYFEYKWVYYFDPKQTDLDDVEFYSISSLDRKFIKDGRIIKATLLANLSPMIELFLRDERAYTAVSLLDAAFNIHYFCLICSLSDHPFHDHISKEFELWEHLEVIPKMEVAIVYACRCVESILGEPPNRNKDSAVLRHKDKWIALTGINPDDIFTKANISFLDYYYSLFFDLRNPSAHSYGYIHIDLERAKAVQAQTFAAIILRGYIELHEQSFDISKSILHFNQELLDRVSENMTTRLTREGQDSLGIRLLNKE